MDTKITIRLDEHEHKAFKVKLAKNGHTAQQVLLAAVHDYLRAKKAENSDGFIY